MSEFKPIGIIHTSDALDGTPVLDLKPYPARRDAIRDTRVGAWAQEFGD